MKETDDLIQYKNKNKIYHNNRQKLSKTLEVKQQKKTLKAIIKDI